MNFAPLLAQTTTVEREDLELLKQSCKQRARKRRVAAGAGFKPSTFQKLDLLAALLYLSRFFLVLKLDPAKIVSMGRNPQASHRGEILCKKSLEI